LEIAMSKYDPLLHHLSGSRGPVELTFDDVEEVLGCVLPASARRYPAWWSNSGGTHVQAQAWMAAGYRTEDVDVAAGKVRFVPEVDAAGFGETKQAKFETKAAGAEERKPTKGIARHPAFGAWKGLVKLDPDYDYTQPADPDWGKVYGQ
jgi:hypothetical protein